MVNEILKDQCLLVHESQEAEMIAVKVCNFAPNLVLICYYGSQENTTAPSEIASHLSELISLSQRFSEEGHMVVLAGDFNVALGEV